MIITRFLMEPEGYLPIFLFSGCYISNNVGYVPSSSVVAVAIERGGLYSCAIDYESGGICRYTSYWFQIHHMLFITILLKCFLFIQWSTFDDDATAIATTAIGPFSVFHVSSSSQQLNTYFESVSDSNNHDDLIMILLVIVMIMISLSLIMKLWSGRARLTVGTITSMIDSTFVRRFCFCFDHKSTIYILFLRSMTAWSRFFYIQIHFIW